MGGEKRTGDYGKERKKKGQKMSTTALKWGLSTILLIGRKRVTDRGEREIE